MKRCGMIVVIFISCLAVMTGCGDDGSKKRIWPFTDSGTSNSTTETDGSDDNNTSTNTFQGPATVEATDAEYKDKVGINWSTIDKAVSYNVYRSDTIGGPFTEKIGSVEADDLVNADSTVVTTTTPTSTDPGTVTTTATGGTCDNPVYQATYQSARDIGNGIYIMGGIEPLAEHYTIEVFIGGASKGIVHFSGGLIGRKWTQTMIVNSFNQVLGSSGSCSAVTVNGKKYIKIVSKDTITLTNHHNIVEILWVPLHFLDTSFPKLSSDSSTWARTLGAEKVLISCGDTTRPTVSQVSPAVGATDIALNAKVSVAFSEAIDPATMTESSFKLTAGGTAVAGTVSNTGVFTPSSALAPGTEYTATITSAVKDLAGNELASDYVWKFTTCAASSSSSVSYYFIDTTVSQGGTYYYAITAVDADGNESAMPTLGEEGSTKADDKVPSKVASCSASKGQTGGITVTWSAATDATYYKVYRIDSSSSQVQVGGDITGASSYTDTTVGTGIYSFKVTPYNSYGAGGSSNLDQGYRAATDYEFFAMVYEEEESALSRISKLQASGLDMIGTETVYDLAAGSNGTCYYNATYDLWSDKATVLITFTNYSDFFLTLNGTQNTAANSSGTGKVTGTLNVSGLYSGTVVFDLSLTNQNASGGGYTVTQTGGSANLIPYDYVP